MFKLLIWMSIHFKFSCSWLQNPRVLISILYSWICHGHFSPICNNQSACKSGVVWPRTPNFDKELVCLFRRADKRQTTSVGFPGVISRNTHLRWITAFLFGARGHLEKRTLPEKSLKLKYLSFFPGAITPSTVVQGGHIDFNNVAMSASNLSSAASHPIKLSELPHLTFCQMV